MSTCKYLYVDLSCSACMYRRARPSPTLQRPETETTTTATARSMRTPAQRRRRPETTARRTHLSMAAGRTGRSGAPVPAPRTLAIECGCVATRDRSMVGEPAVATRRRVRAVRATAWRSTVVGRPGASGLRVTRVRASSVAFAVAQVLFPSVEEQHARVMRRTQTLAAVSWTLFSS